MTLAPARLATAGLAASLLLTLSACGSGTQEAADSPSAPAVTSAPAAASASAAPEVPAGPISGPCDLLTAEQLTATLGVELGSGEETVDEARQVQTCQWATDDLTTIVVAGLTDVAAEEAYQTNVDLAPAYFEGDPVDTTVPGADKAYAVQQPDVGWVVGAIAAGRFVQVQVGGTDITQAMAETLAADAIARLAG